MLKKFMILVVLIAVFPVYGAEGDDLVQPRKPVTGSWFNPMNWPGKLLGSDRGIIAPLADLVSAVGDKTILQTALGDAQKKASDLETRLMSLEAANHDLSRVNDSLHLLVSKHEEDEKTLLTTVSEKERLETQQKTRAELLEKEKREKEELLVKQAEEQKRLRQLLQDQDALQLSYQKKLEEKSNEADATKALLEKKEQEVSETRQSANALASKLAESQESVKRLQKSIDESNPYNQVCQIIRDRARSDAEAMALILGVCVNLGLDFDQIKERYGPLNSATISHVAFTVSQTYDWEKIVQKTHESAQCPTDDRAIEKLQNEHFRSYGFLNAFYFEGAKPVLYGGTPMRPFTAKETGFETRREETLNALLKTIAPARGAARTGR